MPKRLLEISENGNERHVRLVLPQEKSPYLALSYCWGNKQGLICKTSLEEMWKTIIPWDKIPATVQDAALITTQLGIKYLWVDRFCIVQDDEVDVEMEIVQMPEIYYNAELTISATRADCAEKGFLYPNQFDVFCFSEEKFILPARINKSRASAYVGTPPTHRTSPGVSWLFPQPLDSRAWTFQESLLSRRLLHFTLREIQWECQAVPAMEQKIVADMCQRSPQLPAALCRMRDRANFNSIIASRLLYNKDGTRLYKRLNLEDSEKPDIHPWQGLVEEYTLRQMKYPTDRARAISGIAAKIAAKTRDTYCAGLWRSTFASQLGWFCLKRNRDIPFGMLYSFQESGLSQN